MADLRGGSTVGGHLIWHSGNFSNQLVSYENRVVLAADAGAVNIGITGFNKDRDTILVFRNSVALVKDTNYNISFDSTQISSLEGNWINGSEFYFLVLSSINGKSSPPTLSSFTSSYTVSTAGVTNIPINQSMYNSSSDKLLVYLNGKKLFEGSDFTKNLNGVSVDLVGISTIVGDKIGFEVWKNVISNLPTNDGSLITDGTINNAKLASDIKIGSLSLLSTTAKTDLVSAVNELFQNVGDGKTSIASAITGKGIAASGSDTFASLSSKISSIPKGQGNAVEAQVLSGIQFSNSDGVLRTGTMINRQTTGDDNFSSSYPTLKISKGANVQYGSWGTTTPAPRLAICPPTGYYPGGGAGYVTAEASEVAVALGLTAAKIAAGNSICNITGTFTSDGTATAAQILTGQKAYVNGALVTGTMANRSNTHTTGTNQNAGVLSGDGVNYAYIMPAAGYYDGSTAWARFAQPDLVASSILTGKTIFGVAGNVIAGKRYATGTTTATTITITLGWQPKIIMVTNTSGGFWIAHAIVGVYYQAGAVISYSPTVTGAPTYPAYPTTVPNVHYYPYNNPSIVTENQPSVINATGFSLICNGNGGGTFTWSAWEG